MQSHLETSLSFLLCVKMGQQEVCQNTRLPHSHPITRNITSGECIIVATHKCNSFVRAKLHFSKYFFVMLQGNGILRFFHRKHQCYVVGEGSFAGYFGFLPEVDEDEEAEQVEELLQSTIRKRSASPISMARDLKELEVVASVEPLQDRKDEADTAALSVSPRRPNRKSASSKNHAGTIVPRKQLNPALKVESFDANISSDDVVTEDGETIYYCA